MKPTTPRRRRLRAVAAVAVVATALSACSFSFNVGQGGETTTPEGVLGGLRISYEIGERNSAHPDGAGPLRIGDPDILRDTYRDAGRTPARWSVRYRFPVALTDTEGRTWEVQGVTDDAAAFFDPAFSEDGPVAVTAGLDGPVTLLVPDLADDGDAAPRTVHVRSITSEFESSLRDRPEHPRLFVDAATFGAFVEQAGGTPWYQIVHAAPGQGGPAEPTIVDVWVEHDDAQGRSSEAWDFDTALEDAGFDVPSHLG